jgi:Zn-dependent protease
MKKMMVPFRMHDSGWLLLALCMLLGVALCGLPRGMVLGYLIAASLVLHELGHIAASLLLRVPVSEFGLCLGGAYNRRAYAGRRRDEAIISAAGPLMNLCLVLPSLILPVIGKQLGLCNMMLCVVNLLPLRSSDGSRILNAIWGANRADGVIPRVSQPASKVPAQMPLQDYQRPASL